MTELFFLLWLADVVAKVGVTCFLISVVTIVFMGFYIIDAWDNWDMPNEKKSTLVRKAMLRCSAVVAACICVSALTPSKNTVLTFAALQAGQTFAEYTTLDETAAKALALLNHKLDEFVHEEEE